MLLQKHLEEKERATFESSEMEVSQSIMSVVTSRSACAHAFTPATSVIPCNLDTNWAGLRLIGKQRGSLMKGRQKNGGDWELVKVGFAAMDMGSSNVKRGDARADSALGFGTSQRHHGCLRISAGGKLEAFLSF